MIIKHRTEKEERQELILCVTLYFMDQCSSRPAVFLYVLPSGPLHPFMWCSHYVVPWLALYCHNTKGL